MTVASAQNKAGPFLDTGGLSYPFTLQVFTSADVKVIRTTVAGDLYSDATLTLGTDYSVTLNPDQEATPGGTVTTTASTPGTYITVLRNISATQGTAIPNQGGFYPEVLERALDKLTMLVQQLQADIGRSLLLSYADTGTTLNSVITALVDAVNDAEAAALAADGYATDAGNFKIDAAGSATLAQRWANETPGPVAGGEFSAKKYAQDAAQSAAQAATSSGVPPVAGHAGKVLGTDGTTTSWQLLDKDSLGLDQVDNTADADKPVSTLQQAAIAALLDIPANVKATAYTLALTDAGKSIDTTANVVIPANSAVAFPTGTTIMVTNTSGSSISISITTDTLRLAGTTTTGTRTLAGYGMCTMRKVSATVWYISGAGLS